MKEEDSLLDVPEDRDSDSDMEETRRFRPHSRKGFMMMGTQTDAAAVTMTPSVEVDHCICLFVRERRSSRR